MTPEITILLDQPITFGAKTISELTLSEPTIGQMETAWGFYGDGKPDAAMRFFTSIIAAQTGCSKQLLSLVPIAKYYEAREYLDNFTVPGPATGETSAAP